MEGDDVAIIDDDSAAATALQWIVEDAGYRPIIIAPNPKGVDALIAEITNAADAAISDHRLGQARPVPYSGAEVVAKANELMVPAVLITSYADSDENTTIREWRFGIPQLLNRGDESNSPAVISEALMAADRERRGVYLPQRRAYRTVVRIQGIRSGPDGHIAEVIVTAWQPQQTVSIPVSMLGESVDLSGLRGRRFMADVNIYADTPGELYFRNFDPAPAIPSDWLLAR